MTSIGPGHMLLILQGVNKIFNCVFANGVCSFEGILLIAFGSLMEELLL